MKNLVIDNHGLQSPNKNQNQTKLERKIEQLKTSERKLLKELKLWETKLKKVNNLANCLTAVDKFASQFLTAKIANERNQEQPDKNWLECLISQQVEFNLKFTAGSEVFGKLIRDRVERELRILQIELENTQNQLQRQERKFVRLQARRQGKILLDCEYRQSLGCLGDYQCENCRINYPATENNQLKGGAC
jgi:hypothetical protein